MIFEQKNRWLSSIKIVIWIVQTGDEEFDQKWRELMNTQLVQNAFSKGLNVLNLLVKPVSTEPPKTTDWSATTTDVFETDAPEPTADVQIVDKSSRHTWQNK